MIKTILLILSLVFSGCATQLSFSRILQIDLDQCELKETVKDYNSTEMLLQYYNCNGSDIATLTKRAPWYNTFKGKNNVIDGVNYEKYYSYLLDGYNFDEDTSQKIWKVDEEVFKSVDYLEGYPNFYNRKKFKINRKDNIDDDLHECWVYFLPDKLGSEYISSVAGGTWI